MPADSFDDIYNIEPAIEAAIKYVVELHEIRVVTTNEASDETQETRPRVHVQYIHSDLYQSNSGAPYYRSRLFSGQLNVLVVSNPENSDNGGIAQHGQLRAKLRNVMAKLRRDLIVTYPEQLPYHTVENIVEQGTSSAITPQDGVLTSQMSFELQVSVKPDAWPAE